MAYYLSKQCFSYKRLKQQIGQQCVSFGKLHAQGEIGRLIPGMYGETTKDGRGIPTESGAAPLLRGGVITTIACFEEFVHDLLEEALYNIMYERKYPHDNLDAKAEDRHFGGTCHKCLDFDYVHLFTVGADERPLGSLSSDIRLHIWSQQYKEKLRLVLVPAISVQPGSGGGIYLSKNIRETLIEVENQLTDSEILGWATELNEQMPRQFISDELFRKISMASNKKSTAKSSRFRDLFIDELFTDGSLNYYYLLDEKCVSHMEIKNGRIICLLLKLFYGFRCIMAHGNSEKTFESNEAALKMFPHCDTCTTYDKKDDQIDKSIWKEIQGIHKLSEKYDECIEQQGKDKVLKKARKFPGKKPIENLADKKAMKLYNMYFSATTCPVQPTAASVPNQEQEDDDSSTQTEDSAVDLEMKFALFHLFRIHHWLEESQREAYVTYHMLVRINQFVLVLAHRMRIAVAKIMMEQYGIDDGIWNVPKDEKKRRDKIKKFEEKHRKRVQELQKLHMRRK